MNDIIPFLSLFFEVGSGIYSAMEKDRAKKRERAYAKKSELGQLNESYTNMQSEMSLRSLTSQGREYTASQRLSSGKESAIKGIHRKYSL